MGRIMLVSSYATQELHNDFGCLTSMLPVNDTEDMMRLQGISFGLHRYPKSREHQAVSQIMKYCVPDERYGINDPINWKE